MITFAFALTMKNNTFTASVPFYQWTLSNNFWFLFNTYTICYSPRPTLELDPWQRVAKDTIASYRTRGHDLNCFHGFDRSWRYSRACSPNPAEDISFCKFDCKTRNRSGIAHSDDLDTICWCPCFVVAATRWCKIRGRQDGYAAGSLWELELRARDSSFNQKMTTW